MCTSEKKTNTNNQPTKDNNITVRVTSVTTANLYQCVSDVIAQKTKNTHVTVLVFCDAIDFDGAYPENYGAV